MPTPCTPCPCRCRPAPAPTAPAPATGQRGSATRRLSLVCLRCCRCVTVVRASMDSSQWQCCGTSSAARPCRYRRPRPQVTPPPRSLGTHALPALTHNGEQIELDDGSFIGKLGLCASACAHGSSPCATCAALDARCLSPPTLQSQLSWSSTSCNRYVGPALLDCIGPGCCRLCMCFGVRTCCWRALLRRASPLPGTPLAARRDGTRRRSPAWRCSPRRGISPI